MKDLILIITQVLMLNFAYANKPKLTVYSPIIEKYGSTKNFAYAKSLYINFCQTLTLKAKNINYQVKIDTNTIAINMMNPAVINNNRNSKSNDCSIVAFYRMDKAAIEINIFRIDDINKNICGVASETIFYQDLLMGDEGFETIISNSSTKLINSLLKETVISLEFYKVFNELYQNIYLYHVKNRQPALANTEIGKFIYSEKDEQYSAKTAIKLITFFISKVKEAYKDGKSLYKTQEFHSNLFLEKYADLKNEYPFTYNLLTATRHLSVVMTQDAQDNKTGIVREIHELDLAIELVQKEYENKEVAKHELNAWSSNSLDYYEAANNIHELYKIYNKSCDKLLNMADSLTKANNLKEARLFYNNVLEKNPSDTATKQLENVQKKLDDQRRAALLKIDSCVKYNFTELAYNIARDNNIVIESRYPEISSKLQKKKNVDQVKNSITSIINLNNLYNSTLIKVEFIDKESENELEINVTLDTNSVLYADGKISNFPMGQDKFYNIEEYYDAVVAIIEDLKINFKVCADSGNLIIKIEGSSDGTPFVGPLKVANGIKSSDIFIIENPRTRTGKTNYGSLGDTNEEKNIKLGYHRVNRFYNYLKQKNIVVTEPPIVNAFFNRSANLRNIKVHMQVLLNK